MQFLPNLFFHQTALFWCIWSHLDPSNHFWGRWDPGDQIWTQGTFGTKFKILHFCHKTPQYGCLQTPRDPSNQFVGDLDPGGQILGPKTFGTKFKNLHFSCKICNTGVYRLAWTPAIIFEVNRTLGPNVGSKGLLAPISKICIF